MKTPYQVRLSYAERDTDKLAPLIVLLEKSVAAERQPYGVGGGSIDLVTFLEITVAFLAARFLNPVVGEYAKGLFAADKAKALGEAHRRKLIEALGRRWEDILELSKGIQEALQTAEHLIARKEAITLALSFDAFSASFVLNPIGRSPDMFKTLPNAILDFLLICGSETLPPDVKAIQFWYDTSSRYWRYVFIPTFTRRYIDRFIDLADHQVHHLSSPEEFISRFDISQDDEWRFLFSPFAER